MRQRLPSPLPLGLQGKQAPGRAVGAVEITQGGGAPRDDMERVTILRL
jgi:hypothetical protein